MKSPMFLLKIAERLRRISKPESSRSSIQNLASSSLVRPPSERIQDTSPEYEQRVAAEKNIYNECVNVHDLPGIYHYWSNRYVRPKLEAFGFSSPQHFFCEQLATQCRRDLSLKQSFVSVGSGNCDIEIETAISLCDKGLKNFKIECLDLNEMMLDRGRLLAKERQVSEYLTFTDADFNRWRPLQKYDAVVANQALHHVVGLEDLFSSIKRSLKTDGMFLVSDMIGRNGHMRWPEALAIVHEFWRMMPASYRFNHQLKRHEELYENWDCSTEGFEGIRAQDILPLLIERFHFELFIGFANVIDIFVDRGFGPNFDEKRDWDREFIDRVHERDEEGNDARSH